LQNAGTYVLGGEVQLTSDNLTETTSFCFIVDSLNPPKNVESLYGKMVPNSALSLPIGGWYVAASAQVTLYLGCQLETSPAFVTANFTAIQVQ
jgi:hypothetical protein